MLGKLFAGCDIQIRVPYRSTHSFMWQRKKDSVAIATINRTILWFNKAFQGLSADVPMIEIEKLAVLVHHSLNGKTRTFHSAEHVFSMCEGMNPIQILAALFHDVVYRQLDDGFPALVADLMADVTYTQDGVLHLQAIKPEDTATVLCADLFGFSPRQVLQQLAGMNEFLSAVVAARLLHSHLTAAQLIAVLACIEATIFFRVPDSNGRAATDNLAQRVQAQGKKFLGHYSDQDLAVFVNTVLTDAVTLANRDVAGITEASPEQCLMNTLLLIEESNTPLMAAGVYTVQQYRSAVLRMKVFLLGLSPEFICQCHDGYPDAATRRVKGETARRNIEFSCAYLGAIVASTAIIEALALSTGADAPLAMFLGKPTPFQGGSDALQDFLPEPPSVNATDANLLKVLEMGQLPGSADGLSAAPLTVFLYRHAGIRGTEYTLLQAQKMFDGDLSPQSFLKTLDKTMLRTIIHACARVAVSRAEALLVLESSLCAHDA